MSRPTRGRWLSLLMCAFVLVLPAFAGAQTTTDELARRHFESGAAYLEQAEYESALREFQKAHELSNRPEILINVATVHERLGQLEEAIGALERYLAEAPDGEHVETVRIRVKNLEKRLEAQAPEPAEATPAPAPEATAETPADVPPPAPAAADEGEAAAPSKVPAYVLFSVGGVSAAASILTGVLANAEHNEAEDTCAPTCTDDELSAGRTLAITSTVLTAAAIVSAGVGALLFFKASSAESQASKTRPDVGVGVAPGGAFANARWRF